jgi:hypothetical protein
MNRRMVGNSRALRELFIDKTLIHNTQELAKLSEAVNILMTSDLKKLELLQMQFNNINVELAKFKKANK